ncbi:hypothetical protein AVEN_273988-2-1, partial [Araneus ventricosus]
FKETGSVCDCPRVGRPSVSESKVDLVRREYQRSPTKSIRSASRELLIPVANPVRTMGLQLPRAKPEFLILFKITTIVSS